MGSEAIDVALRAGVDSIEHGWWITGALIDRAAASDTPVVPTLSVLYEKEQHHARGRPIWPPVFDAVFGTLEQRLSECRDAHAAGVPLALGTDAANPGVRHGTGAIEMRLLTQAGLSPLEAIAAGTSRAAGVCGLAERTGSLAPGKAADLLVVRGNPAEAIDLLVDHERILAVVRNGRPLKGGRTLGGYLAANATEERANP
jgi:imidazolonepropionase-like amidohydrolase